MDRFNYNNRLNMKKFVMYLTAFVTILVVVGSVYVICRISSEPRVPSKSENFSAYVGEYTQVAEFYYNDYQKYNTDILIYSVPVWNDNMDLDIVCYTEGFTHDLIIGEELYEAFTKITNSYYLDKQHLEYICVYEGFVSFCNNNGRASYVYSLNDTEPSYIKNPNESKCDIFVKHLCNSWYFISESY